MASLHPVQPRALLPKQLANFTNSCAGLDLTLRLIQAVAIVAAEVCVDNATVKGCLIATAQLGLARRYLRFFGFLDCFGHAYDLLAGDSSSKRTISTTMELVESSCLGMYLILEDLTMLHDMNIWLVPWYTTVLMEANKFWFYAICLSIARTVGELFLGSAAQSETQKGQSSINEKKADSGNASPSKPVLSTTSLLNRIVVNSLDLTLPTSFLGWTTPGNLGVGMAMTVSSVLAWGDSWAGAQR